MREESDLCTVVGVNIRRVREAAGMTQAELARKIETTQSQIGKYERGEQNMSLNRLEQISEALGVCGSELLRQSDMCG